MTTHLGRGFVRSSHPYAYKSGEWGQIIGERERDGRGVWMIVWPDGFTDEWVIDDPVAGYEFSEDTTMPITPGTRWKNIHSDREDTVREVGPCASRDGAERVWLVDAIDVTPADGWDPAVFLANWKPLSG